MVRYKILLAVLLLAIVVVPFGLQAAPSCPMGTYTPTVRFDVKWDSATETVSITHAGGDELSPSDDHGTISLFVMVVDDGTEREEQLMWMNQNAGEPPVRMGDSFTIQQSQTNIVLSPGDEIRVIWRGNIGYHWPPWCFNQGVGNHVVWIDRI